MQPSCQRNTKTGQPKFLDPHPGEEGIYEVYTDAAIPAR